MRLPIEGCGTLIRRMRIGRFSLSIRRSRTVRRGSAASRRTDARALEAGERGGKVFRLEIGPHPLGEVKFGVSALPKKEIGQALFAAGPDDEIDVPESGFAGDEPRKAGARE